MSAYVSGSSESSDALDDGCSEVGLEDVGGSPKVSALWWMFCCIPLCARTWTCPCCGTGRREASDSVMPTKNSFSSSRLYLAATSSSTWNVLALESTRLAWISVAFCEISVAGSDCWSRNRWKDSRSPLAKKLRKSFFLLVNLVQGTKLLRAAVLNHRSDPSNWW